MKVVAIIPAGGSSKRIGNLIPKQFVKFDGKELIGYTLDVFQKSKLIDAIVVAVNPKYFETITKLKKKFNLTKITKIVEGGKERQDSVFNALSSLSLNKKDLVIVHDAARPLLSQSILSKAVNVAKQKGNSLVAIQARDTLVEGIERVESYIDRKKIHYVQTPQIFRYAELLYAMESAKKDKFVGTDESMLMKRVGFKINLVEGSIINFKITTKEDLKIFDKLISGFKKKIKNK